MPLQQTIASNLLRAVDAGPATNPPVRFTVIRQYATMCIQNLLLGTRDWDPSWTACSHRGLARAERERRAQVEQLGHAEGLGRCRTYSFKGDERAGPELDCQGLGRCRTYLDDNGPESDGRLAQRGRCRTLHVKGEAVSWGRVWASAERTIK